MHVFLITLLLMPLLFYSNAFSSGVLEKEEKPLPPIVSSSVDPDEFLFTLPEKELSLTSSIKVAESEELLTQEDQQGIAHTFTTNLMRDKSRKPLAADDSDFYTNLLARHHVPLTYLTGLSIDGGGTRGVIPAVLLEELQRYLNKPLYHYFDYIGGTSIGGIIAEALTAQDPVHKNQPLLEPKKIVSFFDQSELIFPKHKVTCSPFNLPLRIWDGLKSLMMEARATLVSRYEPDGLEGLLKKKLREDTYFHNALTHTLVTAVDTQFQRPQTYLFDSREAAKLYASHNLMMPLWKIGRSTSAAPTYFPAYPLTLEDDNGHILSQHQLIDGGLWVNNPTGIVARSLLKWASEEFMYASHKNIVMLSLGTGYAEESKPLPRDAGLLTAAAPVVETLMGVSSFSVHETMQEVLGRKNYIRINPKLPQTISLDDTDRTNRNTLKAAAESKIQDLEKFIQGPFRKILEADEFRLEPLRDRVEGQVESHKKGKEKEIQVS